MQPAELENQPTEAPDLNELSIRIANILKQDLAVDYDGRFEKIEERLENLPAGFKGEKGDPGPAGTVNVVVVDSEDVELFLERVHTQGVFHQHGQAVDAAAEIDWIATQVHHRDVIGRSHHGRAATVARTRDKVAALP